MKRNLLSYAALAVLSVGSALAQETFDAAAVQKIRTEGMDNSKVMQTAFYLTDVAGPRLSNSPGLKRAENWAVQTLKSYGLQNVKLEPWGTFGKGWEVEKYYAAMTVPYYHALIASPKAWSGSTNGAIKGEVMIIKADSVPDLEKYKGKLAGKIVMLDVNSNINRSFKPDATRYTDEELSKLAEPVAPRPASQAPQAPSAAQTAQFRNLRALRQAMADFFVQEKVGLLLNMARGTDGTFFTSNGNSYAADAKPAIAELEMSAEDFLRLQRLVKAGQKVEMEAEIRTKFQDKDLQGYNVLGEIPGTDPKLKDQVVMVGAHLDSWHAATGATDNAAGSAVMMEVMRIIQATGLKPKRTIRIALWSSEEQGLHGSRNYVANHFGNRQTMQLKPEHGKVSAYYNLDNGTGKIRGVYLQGNEGVGPIFKAWLEPFKDLGATTITPRNTGGTDHLAFDALGIPGFQFIQDGIDYNTRTHHTNQDTYERLIEDDLKQAATIIAAFAYNTAQRADMLPRKELPKPQPAPSGN